MDISFVFSALTEFASQNPDATWVAVGVSVLTSLCGICACRRRSVSTV